MFNNNRTPLECLDDVVQEAVSHISDFTQNKADFTRNRKLDAATTIKLTLNMQGQSLNTEMINAFPNMNDRVTASAYEQQKAKLSPELFLHLFHEYNKTNTCNNNLYKGKYTLYAIDGSDFNLPYQSKSKYAITPKRSRYRKDGELRKPISVLHCNLLYNITDRTYHDVIFQGKGTVDERNAAIDMLDKLDPESPYIVLMDRGYDGFNMIEHCNRLNGNGYYVIRTKTGAGGIKEIAELPDEECDVMMDFLVTTSGFYYYQNKDTQIVHWIRAVKKHHKKYLSPNSKEQRWDFKQFEHVKCRVVKFRINNPETGREEWEVLLTNLNRVEFPLSEMKALYHMRWDIETSFRELKYALGGVMFHSRKDDFIEMELIAHLIMFNAVSRTINSVSVPQTPKRKCKYVVSFKDAVTLVRKYYRLYNTEHPNSLFTELLGYTRPNVSGRADKRKMGQKSAVWFVYRVA